VTCTSEILLLKYLSHCVGLQGLHTQQQLLL